MQTVKTGQIQPPSIPLSIALTRTLTLSLSLILTLTLTQVRSDILLNYPANGLLSCVRVFVSFVVAFSYPLQINPGRRCTLTLIDTCQALCCFSRTRASSMDGTKAAATDTLSPPSSGGTSTAELTLPERIALVKAGNSAGKWATPAASNPARVMCDASLPRVAPLTPVLSSPDAPDPDNAFDPPAVLPSASASFQGTDTVFRGHGPHCGNREVPTTTLTVMHTAAPAQF